MRNAAHSKILAIFNITPVRTSTITKILIILSYAHIFISLKVMMDQIDLRPNYSSNNDPVPRHSAREQSIVQYQVHVVSPRHYTADLVRWDSLC